MSATTARTARARLPVALVIDGETVENGAGNGPINALDMALRADLRRYAVYIDEMRLVDFKVRILNSGTEAVTRVTIESMDGEGSHGAPSVMPILWSLAEALLDAVNYNRRGERRPRK